MAGEKAGDGDSGVQAAALRVKAWLGRLLADSQETEPVVHRVG